MKQTLFAIGALAALLVAAPATAATQIDVTLGASDSDFVNARPPALADRQYVGSGSIQFLTTLTNGTYGLSDIASFVLNVELKIRPTGAPAGFYATADYKFGLSDLTAFQITYIGGTPVSASWTLNPVSWYQNTGGITPLPLSVDFVSGNNGVFFYSWSDGVKTLVANSDDFEATFKQTAAVPEASTWALMIFGLGGVGLVLRRHPVLAPATV